MPSRVMSCGGRRAMLCPSKRISPALIAAKSRNRHQRRSLPCAIRTDDRRDFALPDLEIDASKRLDMTVSDFTSLYTKHRLLWPHDSRATPK